MHRLLPRLPRLLASTFAISAIAAAEPAPPAPVPVPYPNMSVTDASTGLASGKRMHKPYTATLQADTAAPQSAACAAATNVQPVNVASDPEEGGQIARTAAQKPGIGEMTVSKKADTASTKLAESAAPTNSCP